MDGGKTTWVVVLEAATGVDDRSLHQMLQVLADVQGVALHCPDRYAVQTEVAAGGQAEALFVALCRWRSALAAAGQPATEVVRAEVLSREEFESDCRRAYGDVALPPIDDADRPLLRLVSS